MKTIIEMAREAFKFPDAVVWDAWMPSLERFAALVEAAHTERLLAGVEMPEAVGSAEVFSGHNAHGLPEYAYVDAYTADQMRDYAAAAVMRKDAEMRQMGEDLIAIQTMHSEQKARLYEKCADLRNERDALKAENERLRADAARYQWLRVQSNSDEIGVSNYIDGLWFFELNEAGIDAAIDAAMKGQP